MMIADLTLLSSMMVSSVYLYDLLFCCHFILNKVVIILEILVCRHEVLTYEAKAMLAVAIQAN